MLIEDLVFLLYCIFTLKSHRTVSELTSIRQTDELRRQKPLQLMKLELSLWKVAPHYLRRVSNALKKHTGKPLPLTCTPIKFRIWIGGDRDGNPNETAKVSFFNIHTSAHYQRFFFYHVTTIHCLLKVTQIRYAHEDLIASILVQFNIC
ncbi:putative phosphoenolpyruvate carboxylase [Medicago truncatula]|uniref:Putative phosphoenolpyruvate carboxylase n=1 Tax=Medicago truncatula TaxID=3880 RepID=A0A396H551_MEDTR|nr:putative phosphoenolpyruvate carboxylase [Medicago truncatula]